MRQRHFILLYGLVIGLGACATSPMMRSDARTGNSPPVVFVCEHGAAKSIIAAAYFNRLADEQNLPIRAVARGLTPQDELAKSATIGLHADGLSPGLTKPIALNQDEAHSATRLVSFLPLPEGIAGDRPLVEWDDVPATSDGYDIARDKIVAHVNVLVDELATQHAPLKRRTPSPHGHGKKIETSP